MKTFLSANLTLICAAVSYRLFHALYFTVQEEPCKYNVPATSSVIKCGDRIYHRSPEAIVAYNECGAGKNGTAIPISHVACVHEKLGLTKNGVNDITAMVAAGQRDFPEHFEALMVGVKACFDRMLNTKESDLTDPVKQYACVVQAFQDVCKHKSCDWLNTLD